MSRLYLYLLKVNITYDFQLLISCPITPECRHFDHTTQRFPLVAGLANLLSLSVRSKVIKDLVSTIKEHDNELQELRKTRRNPLILIIDKV